MSYNITSCKVKKLKDLVIPLNTFLGKKGANGFKPDIKTDGSSIQIRGDESGGIKGSLINTDVHVDSFDCSGTFSGRYLGLVLRGALSQSTGELECVFIWEGGGAITRLHVKDGRITEKQVEL